MCWKIFFTFYAVFVMSIEADRGRSRTGKSPLGIPGIIHDGMELSVAPLYNPRLQKIFNRAAIRQDPASIETAMNAYQELDVNNMYPEAIVFLRTLLQKSDYFLYSLLQKSHDILGAIMVSVQGLYRRGIVDTLLYQLTQRLMDVAKRFNLAGYLHQMNIPNEVSGVMRYYESYRKKIQNDRYLQWYTAASDYNNANYYIQQDRFNPQYRMQNKPADRMGNSAGNPMSGKPMGNSMQAPASNMNRRRRSNTIATNLQGSFDKQAQMNEAFGVNRYDDPINNIYVSQQQFRPTPERQSTSIGIGTPYNTPFNTPVYASSDTDSFTQYNTPSAYRKTNPNPMYLF